MGDRFIADVLVVGAGPVGLTMAAELARHGVRSRLVDRLPEPLPYCRAMGVTPRTLEVWDDMGIAARMIDAGLWITGMRSVIAGQPAHDVVMPALEGEAFLASFFAGAATSRRDLTDRTISFGRLSL